jgi:hypothetical protein
MRQDSDSFLAYASGYYCIAVVSKQNLVRPALL